MGVERNTKRFIRKSTRETARRLLEIAAQCAALSILDGFIKSIGIAADAGVYFVIRMLLFLGFQICTFLLCRKSILRVHYYGRYYTANCIAYILFVIISFAVMFSAQLQLYMLLCGVTLSLLVKQNFTVQHMILSILLFHSLTMVVTLLAPIGRRMRRIARSRS